MRVLTKKDVQAVYSMKDAIAMIRLHWQPIQRVMPPFH